MMVALEVRNIYTDFFIPCFYEICYNCLSNSIPLLYKVILKSMTHWIFFSGVIIFKKLLQRKRVIYILISDKF